MKKGLALLAVAAAVLTASVAATSAGAKSDATITGAGSTFVAPLVGAWIPAWGHAFGNSVQYSAVGSGAGIAAITNKQVDFGASDAPFTPDQQSACSDCVQIPWALSAVSVFYNVPGAPVHVRLDGATISKIFLGQITNWNDPAIAKLNPGGNFPNLKITPVWRSDGSGTSYAFTDYLSAVNGTWKTKIGISTQPAFPAGEGAKGSSGVAGVVSRTDGAVGYADIAYATANHLHFAAVKNAAGKYLYPSLRRIQAAALAYPKVPANNEMHITDPPRSAKGAYPICTYTYVIVPQVTSKAALLKKFIFYAVTSGQQFGVKLRYVPIPKTVLVASEKTLNKVHS